MGRHKSTSKSGPGKGDSKKEEQESNAEEEEEEFELPSKLLEPSSVCINPEAAASAAAASSSSSSAAAAAASADPPLYLPPEIACKLKPHQIEGVRFCWRAIVGPDLSLARAQKPEQGNGCLLAHFCGLGKTVQVISFLYMYLNSGLGRCALVVAPVNTLANWIAEFEQWLRPRNRLDVWCLDSCSAYAGKKVQSVRYKCLKAWAKQGGVLIAGYEGFRQIWQAGTAAAAATKKGAKASKHQKNSEAAKAAHLLLTAADLCVADEAHRVKSATSTLSKAIKQLTTHRRIALTGTPLQNNVGEYFTMVDFIRPGFLGSVEEFRHRFDAPIRAGMCSDSAPEEVRMMQKRIHVLVKKLQPLLHRVDYAMLKAGAVKGIEFVAQPAADGKAEPAAVEGSVEHHVSKLPGKSEYVLFTHLTPFQRTLYERFIATHQRMTLFRAYHSLMKLTNHPSCLESTSAILDADEEPSDEEAESKPGRRGGKGAKNNAAESGGAPWYGSLLDASTGYRTGRVEDSSKLVLCMFLLASALHAREKVLVFSQSLDLLDLLENVLQSYFELAPREGYFRLDGSTSSSARHESIVEFNDESSPARVFLISTRAGCLGVNLVGASRVIIFDAAWNPSNDTQAIYRAYRFGQRRHVSVYRLISAGGLEEKIYRRQLMKNGLSLRVVDKHEVDRLFSREGVEALWSLEPTNEAEEDRVALAALAQVHKAAGGGLQISQGANGQVLLEMEDSDDEDNGKAAAAASSSAAAAAATATSSTHQVLDPSRPITDPLLCHVLSLLGPKRLRSHFASMVLQAQKQKALAAQLRKQAQEQGEINLVASAAAANGKANKGKSEAMKSSSKAEAEKVEESSSSSEGEDLTPAARRKLRAANKAALAAALAASLESSSSSSAAAAPAAAQPESKKKLIEPKQQASSDEEEGANEERKGRDDDDAESMSDVEITGTKTVSKPSKNAAAMKQEQKSNAGSPFAAAAASAAPAVPVKRGRGRPRKLPVRSSGKPDIEDDGDEKKPAPAAAAAAAAPQGLKSKPAPAAASSDEDDESEKKQQSKSKQKQKAKVKSAKKGSDSDESFGENSDDAEAEEAAFGSASGSASNSRSNSDDDDDDSDAPTSSEEEAFSSEESASNSDDSDDSGYGSARRKKKRGGGKGGRKKAEGTRGVKKAHFLLDIDLPTDTPAAQQIMEYCAAMIAEDDDEEDEEAEEKKSSDAASSSDAIPPAALTAAQSLSVSDSSWIACIQQPDALLIDMPELRLTAQEAEAAEIEFTHALANEPNFGMVGGGRGSQNDRMLAVAQANALIQQQQLAAYAFLQTMQQLVFPPPTAQLLMPAAYMAIKNSYFEQLSRDHSGFLQRVYSDVLRGDNASQAHLQAHFASFVEGAVKTMGPEAWNVEAVQAAAAAATAEANEVAAAAAGGGVGAGFAAPAVAAAAADGSSAPARKRKPAPVRGKGSSKAMAIDLSDDEDEDESSDEEDDTYTPNNAAPAKAKKQKLAQKAAPTRAPIPAAAAAAPARRPAPAAPQPPPPAVDDDDDLPPLLPM